MKIKYLLPCSACDQRVEVDATDAGLSVACPCGAQVDVPTMRGLKQLETVVRESADAGSSWSGWHSGIFLSLLVAAAFWGWAGYRLPRTPPEPAVDVEANDAVVQSLSPVASYQFWLMLREGLDTSEMQLVLRYNQQRERYIRWNWVLASLGTAGGVAAGCFGIGWWSSARRRR